MISLCGLRLVVDANSKGVLSNYTCSLISILTTNISKNVAFIGNVVNTSSEPESIDPTCLPNLTRVAAKLSWLPYLITDQPVSKVVTTGCVPHEHSNDLNFFTLGTASIQKLMTDYSYLDPKPGHLLASVCPSLAHFTTTTTRLGTFLKNQEVC
jgi:hypothetical protein